MLRQLAQEPSSAEALKAAVCDGAAPRVREVFERHPALRTAIDDPLPDYSFGQHALFAAVQRSDRETIEVLLGAGAGFGVLDDEDFVGTIRALVEAGAVLPQNAQELEPSEAVLAVLP